MDRLKTIETVRAHLLKQGEQAISGAGCRYRTAGGTKSCAVGCLIPQELYHDGIEGRAVDAVLDENPEIRKALGAGTGKDYSLLEEMQKIHDGFNDPISLWPTYINTKFDELVQRYGP